MEECRDLCMFSSQFWAAIDMLRQACDLSSQAKPSLCSVGNLLPSFIDLYWTCLDFSQSLQGSWHLYRGRPKKLPWKELVGGNNL